MAQKKEYLLLKLLAEITGVTVIVVPNKFKLPAEYRGIGLQAVFKAWGISCGAVGNDKCELVLPKGWQVKRLVDLPYVYDAVYDAKGTLRIGVLTKSVTIELPVITQMNGDYEKTRWVEVLHRGKEVFRSTTFESVTDGLEDVDSDDEDVPMLSEEERDSAGLEELYLSTKPYYDEAEAFVREHYPLLDQDPNAYW